jgi:DNA-binding GntR family transcriptional regulator
MSKEETTMPAKPVTYKDYVKEFLMGKIYEGKYKPGEKITVVGIAQELDVSQSVVREALAELKVKKVIESIPYKETYIRNLSKEEVRDAIQVRTEMEELAFKWILENQTNLSLLVKDLEEILKEMRKSSSDTNSNTYRENDISFHRRIFIEAQSPTMLFIWDLLGDIGWIYLGLYTSQTFRQKMGEKEFSVICDIYHDIIESIEKRDLPRFSSLLRNTKLRV